MRWGSKLLPGEPLTAAEFESAWKKVADAPPEQPGPLYYTSNQGYQNMKLVAEGKAEMELVGGSQNAFGDWLLRFRLKTKER